MKVFVASIDCWHFRDSNNLSVAEKTRLTIEQLAKIHADAKTELGEDAITLVVMQEYAFTPNAIPAAEKKSSLAALHAAVKKYNNMIFVPGSYATYDEYKDKTRRAVKTEKLLANYRSLSQSKLVNCFEFRDEEADVLRRSKSGELKTSVFMQNCAYILTATSKFKHKKCAPFYETDKLEVNSWKGIYYIGADHPVKEITINDKTFNLGLLICREHYSVESEVLTAKKFNPLIQVVISDTIPTQKNKLFGALNVHVDSDEGLMIFQNASHYQAKEISELKGYTYRVGNSDHPRMPVKISTINTEIQLTKPKKSVATFLQKLFDHKRGRNDETKSDLDDTRDFKKPSTLTRK